MLASAPWLEVSPHKHYHIGPEKLADPQHLRLIIRRVRERDRLLVEYLFQTRPLDDRQPSLLQPRDRHVRHAWVRPPDDYPAVPLLGKLL